MSMATVLVIDYDGDGQDEHEHEHGNCNRAGGHVEVVDRGGGGRLRRMAVRIQVLDWIWLRCMTKVKRKKYEIRCPVFVHTCIFSNNVNVFSAGKPE